jgi:MFS family permease
MLPTYEQAGVLSTVLLVFLRLCQGIFLGGEMAGSAVISAEAVPDHLRGLFQGLVQSAQPLGLLLASADLGLTNILYPGTALQAFGWRFMFLLGIFPLIIAIASRFFVTESPEWEAKVKPVQKKIKIPLMILLRDHWKIILPMVVFWLGLDINLQISALYLPVFLRTFTPATIAVIALAGVVPNLVRAAWAPAAGYISDLMRNRRWLLYAQAIILAIFAYPLFGLIKTGALVPVLVGVSLVQLVVMVGLSLQFLYASESVPTNVRFSMIGIIQLGNTFAAFAPFITTYVADVLKDPLLSITGAVTIGGAVQVVCLYFMPKEDRAGKPFL